MTEKKEGKFTETNETIEEEFVRKMKEAMKSGIEEVYIIATNGNTRANLKNWRTFTIDGRTKAVWIETTQGKITFAPTNIIHVFPLKASII